MRRSSWILAVVVVLASVIGGNGMSGTGKEAFISPLRPVVPKHLPRFTFNRDEAPIRVPLVVNVFLLNVDYNSNNVYTAVSASDLENFLTETFPVVQPSCIETGEKLHVSYSLWYHVAHVDSTLTSQLQEVVAAAMKPLPAPDAEGEKGKEEEGKGKAKPVARDYAVPLEGAVEDKLKEIHDIYYPSSAKRYRFDGLQEDGEQRPDEGAWFKRGGGGGASGEEEGGVQRYSLMILNLNKKEMLPPGLEENAGPGSYTYRYELGGVSAGDAFLSRGPFAVVDLAAGPSEFGSSQAGMGAVIASSLPRAWVDWRPKGGELMQSSIKFQSFLVSTIRSAISHLFAPDVLLDEIDLSEQVLVAVMVLRDHNQFDPLQPGHEYSMDTELIKAQVERLALPDQPIHLVFGLHNLQEHERVAIAVEKSSRTDSTHRHKKGKVVSTYKHYLDSAVFFDEMAKCADYLASGLIDAGHPLRHEEMGDEVASKGRKGEGEQRGKPFDWLTRNKEKRGKGREHAGVRVLPVYLLSLQQHGVPTLVDDSALYGVSKDAAIVLQHGSVVSSPYFSNKAELDLKATNPTVPVIAAIASSLSGIAPPAARYSKQHLKTSYNYLWSLGYSPFPPFAASPVLSDVLADHSIRNGVLWRLDSAVERGTQTLQILDKFASKYIFDELGDRLEPAQYKRLDSFYGAKDAAANPPEPSLSHTTASSTLRAIYKELLELQSDLSAASEQLFRAHISEAFFKAEVCLTKAINLHRRARNRLEHTEFQLACCQVKHQLLPRGEWLHWIRAALVGIITVAGVVLVLVRDPERRSKLQGVAKRWQRL